MRQVAIIPATDAHIEAIAGNVRPEDRDELWAAFRHSPEEAMMLGLKYSDSALTGTVDGKPICMWGVTPVDFLSGMGAPWMVGTKLLDQYAVTFLRRCGAGVLELFNGYDRLENYVDVRNTRAILWLETLGFIVEDEARPYGIFKRPFRKFYKEAAHV